MRRSATAASRAIAAAHGPGDQCAQPGLRTSSAEQGLVTDITYIRTYEGWLFLAAVMDLYSRQIVGWATAPTMTSDLVLQALVAAAWRRKPGPCQRNSDNPKTRIFAPRTSTIAHHDLTP